MKITTLVVSYGARDVLARCLKSLRQPGCDEVIVVDNASPDGAADLVRSEFPEVRLIALPDNRGFSAAVNVGSSAARGDALFLLNPDTEVPPGTMARIATTLTERRDATAVGFRQVDAEGMFQLSFGLKPGFFTESLRRTAQRRIDRGDRRVAGLIDRAFSEPRPLPWVSAASLLVHRSAFEEVGGFDEGFFLYFEDIDFCLRLSRAGGVVYYDPSVTVLHHRGVCASAAPEPASRAYRRSQVRFFEKHKGSLARRAIELYLRARGYSF